eukprot:CAMPEP_0197504182 /NCGR_PEP_ID=MMETSP1312-20131121/3301_1 /TAXON_ID=464262 /ORGANISM="Genus nov. species nov., Strain RCC2335" /LENGTH=266 /DNA_ID=CAMNT_0043051007 /DNA_START=1475 /DNA_END=2276 /DNA_ORIENTATION=+
MSIALVRLRISPLRKRAPGLLVFVEISRLERHGAPRSRNVGVASRASVGKRAWDRPRARVADIPCAEALGASRQGAEACPSGAVPSRPPAGAVSPGAGDDGSRAEALGTLALPHVGLRLAVLRPRVALLLLLEAGLALGREAALAEGQEQGQRELVVAPAADRLASCSSVGGRRASASALTLSSSSSRPKSALSKLAVAPTKFLSRFLARATAAAPLTALAGRETWWRLVGARVLARRDSIITPLARLPTYSTPFTTVTNGTRARP